MKQPSPFVLSVLRDLQSRADMVAKEHPGLRHMLVLPRGESIRVPPVPGVRPIGTSFDEERNPRTCTFGEQELVGPLPPRSSWPKGVVPLQAVVIGAGSNRQHSLVEDPYRLHLFFGGSDDALENLQALADDVAHLRDDVTRALSGNATLFSHDVFFTEGNLDNGRVERLDSWLCTMHWWSWFWSESPFRTTPQVVSGGKAYAVDPPDPVVESKLAFSLFDADMLTASAVTLSLIQRFFDERKLKKPSAKHGDWDILTDRQRNSLRVLFELNAFDADSRQRANDIALKAEGSYANLNGFKEPLSNLVFRGLVESKTGREGGYWLTDVGRELVVASNVGLPAKRPSP